MKLYSFVINMKKNLKSPAIFLCLRVFGNVDLFDPQGTASVQQTWQEFVVVIQSSTLKKYKQILRIESFAVINLRGVSTNKTISYL